MLCSQKNKYDSGDISWKTSVFDFIICNLSCFNILFHLEIIVKIFNMLLIVNVF